MVTVVIDGIRCECENTQRITLRIDSEDWCDVESGRAGRSIELIFDSSKIHSSIFGGETHLHVGEKFNARGHVAQVIVDNYTLFEGVAYLRSVEWMDGKELLIVEVIGGASLWAKLAATSLFSATPVPYKDYLSMVTVNNSWYSGSDVMFLPIERDEYAPITSDVNNDGGLRVIRTIDGYHPFLRIEAIMRAIIESRGYTIESKLMESDSFKSLYMSGNYHSAESDVARSRMGFYLHRAEDTSVEGDQLGRVRFSPYVTSNSAGNIVDIQTLESDENCYDNGNTLSIDNGRLIFTPLTQVSVGFEYHLRYITDYRILSRGQLEGFDRFYLPDGQIIEWKITNRFKDRRPALEMQYSYAIIIFEFDESSTYYLYGTKKSGETLLITEVDQRRMDFVSNFECVDCYLDVWNDDTGYSRYDKDWAVYDGYIKERDVTEVDITIRSAPEVISPTTPKSFDLLMIGGAEPSSHIIIKSDTSIKPYFAAYPGYGSLVEFKDLAQHQVSQSVFLSSIQHLYNLRFFTDEQTKKVYIDPYDWFADGEVYDWTNRIIESESVKIRDLAQDVHQTRLWGYQQSDGILKRQSQESEEATIFGDWSVDIESFAAKSNIESRRNPLFSATTNDSRGVMVVGDRDDILSVDSLNFAARVVRYFEMREIDNEKVPYAAFHAPDEDFTLCFEDRDGVEGLNQFYRGQINAEEQSYEISLVLRVSAFDIVSLFSPCVGSPSVLSRFRFKLSGEWIECRFKRLESYIAGSGEGRFVFVICR